MSNANISLGDALRSLDDADLASLLQARPDLLSPIPADFGAMAARANSTASLSRAIDALTKPEQQILIASTILNEPFTLAEIQKLTAKNISAALDLLLSRALIYSDGKGYRIPSTVRTLIGENPAGLGPRAKKKLAIKKLEDAPQGALAILEAMAWGPAVGELSTLSNPPAHIKYLLEEGFLEVVDSRRVLLPREVALHIRNGKVFRELELTQPEVSGTKRKQSDIDSAALSNISTIIRWIEELAHNWSDEPPSALRTGGLGVRDLKHSADHLGVDESCAAFIAEISYMAGLITIDTDDSILPTNAFDLWITQTPEEQWASLVDVWRHSSRLSGLVGRSDSKNIAALGPELDRPGIPAFKTLLLNLLSQNRSLSPASESFASAVAWLSPNRAKSEYLPMLLREIEWLGLTGLGAISSFATRFLERQEELGINKALPKPIDEILLQGDNSAVAPGPLVLELANFMGTVADIESRGGATVFRFSESSIRRGLDHGQSGANIISTLKSHSKTPLPQPLEYMINDVAKRHGKLRVGVAHCYIRCEDDGLITQILHDKKVEHLALRRLAPQVLISENELPELLAGLREAGYLPAAENAAGILLNAPKVRRAKSRPRPPRISIEQGEPSRPTAEAAVKALRVGDRAQSHKRQELPRTSANETLELLQHHITERSILTIGYADTNGGVSQRLIEPKSLSLGTLTALDHSTGEIMQFRIPRITGLSLAE